MEGWKFDLAAAVSGVVGLAIGVVGGWWAHWLSLSRDRRQEHNQAVEPIRAYIVAMQGFKGFFEPTPDAVVIDKYLSTLSSPKREEFLLEWRKLQDLVQPAEFRSGKPYSPALSKAFREQLARVDLMTRRK